MRVDEVTVDKSGRRHSLATPIKRKINNKMKELILKRHQHVFGSDEYERINKQILALKSEFDGLTEPFIEDNDSK